jgi:hypothetical protein
MPGEVALEKRAPALEVCVSAMLEGDLALMEGRRSPSAGVHPPVEGALALSEGKLALDVFLLFYLNFYLTVFVWTLNISGMDYKLSREPRDRMRSPAYPHVGLAEAVFMITKLSRASGGKRSLTFQAAAEALGLKPGSSWLVLRLAALKKFGLIEESTAGDTRERSLRLTNSAMMLVSLSPEEAIHKVLRKQAALRPAIYVDLWERFGPILPVNEPMREYLVNERQFNPQSVDALLGNFRSTVEYAGLMEQALSFDEVAEAIGAGGRKHRPPASEQSKTPVRETVVPGLGQSLLGLSSEQLQALQENMGAVAGRRTTAIPLDGDEDAVLQIPREMTPQRWQTIIDTLALWKRQAEQAGR